MYINFLLYLLLYYRFFKKNFKSLFMIRFNIYLIGIGEIFIGFLFWFSYLCLGVSIIRKEGSIREFFY